MSAACYVFGSILMNGCATRAYREPINGVVIDSSRYDRLRPTNEQVLKYDLTRLSTTIRKDSYRGRIPVCKNHGHNRMSIKVKVQVSYRANRHRKEERGMMA